MPTRSRASGSGAPPGASSPISSCASARPADAHADAPPQLPLDRHADEAAPLGPRAVVVADRVAAEQLVQHEPGVRRALADPAVGDDRLAVEHALAAVELLEVRARLERA